jgi:hypothetical protein
MSYRKPLTETIRCPECEGEKLDLQCMCNGTRRITRMISCACCGKNHRSEDCEFYCKECKSHHAAGDHTN